MSEFDSEHDFAARPSKSQRKREALALQALGERLVELRPAERARIPLPEPLEQAVVEARRIRQRGGRRRQLQFIGRLMREIDAAPIVAALEELDARGRAAAAEHQRAEQWRSRLLEEGDTALAALLDEHPQADRQHLRQLMRQAQQEHAVGKPPRAERQLFRALRALLTP